MTGKPVVYQVFTRLFGNKKTTNKPWGTIEENGVGKFNDFDDKALAGIRELGVTHIWYTGVPHHAVIRDYTEFGISNDDPDVVKGRAGSPYAVKDYYNVNPDLADDPANRLAEFEALIERTHAHGMKVIIDIVPNHVARGYESMSRPDGVEDFGANDDTSVEWARDNNFYYVVGRGLSRSRLARRLPTARRRRAPAGRRPVRRIAGEVDRQRLARARSRVSTTGSKRSRSTTVCAPTAATRSIACPTTHATGPSTNTPRSGRTRTCRTAGSSFARSSRTGWTRASTVFATTWPRWCRSSSGVT